PRQKPGRGPLLGSLSGPADVPRPPAARFGRPLSHSCRQPGRRQAPPTRRHQAEREATAPPVKRSAYRATQQGSESYLVSSAKRTTGLEPATSGLGGLKSRSSPPLYMGSRSPQMR